MKKPSFSTERARSFKLEPLMIVTSIMDARSLTSPALIAKVEVALLLEVETIGEDEYERDRRWVTFCERGRRAKMKEKA